MSKLAQRIAALPAEKRALVIQQLKKKSKRNRLIYPLSHSQWVMWFLNQLASESPAYNVAFAVRIQSQVDLSILRRTVRTLVNRHTALRTTYSMQDGKPIQRVQEQALFEFAAIDASALDSAELEARLVEVYQRPFELEQGPVLRVTFFTRSADEHILFVTAHHVAVDLWSIAVLMDELRVLYLAEVSGTEVHLPLPERQYVDYVDWQRKMLAGAEGKRLWSYWQEQLSGELPVLNLPTDRPRPPVQTFRGATHLFVLNPKLTRQLKALTKDEGVTLYTTMLASFFVLLHHYTGQEDILVGSPMAARSRVEFMRLVGCLTNFVILRGDLSGNITFQQFLCRLYRTVLEALEYQDYPFSLLTEQLEVKRDPSRPPLVDVVFSLEKGFLAPGDATTRLERGELKLEALPFLAQQEGQFDLYLEMVEVNGALHCALRYNTDLFNPSTIARMATHFQVMLERLVANPTQRLANLRPLTEAERHQQLVTWNATEIAFPTDASVHELFEAQVRLGPSAVAAICEGEQLRYHELNERANRLAYQLVARGIGPNIVVALLAERGLALLTAILAVFKAGGAYLPLDPRHPIERHRQVLAQSRSPLVLTSATHLEALAQATAQLPAGQQPEVQLISELLRADGHAVLPHTKPSDLAYVIYTSGSTGVPKGAMVEHRGMLNHLFAKVSDLALSKADVVAQTASQCFDISVWQFWAALLVGGRVQIFPDAVAHDPRRLLAAVEREQVTVLEIVPSLLRVMLTQIADQARPRVTALRWLISTGEALPPDLCREWLRFYPQIPMMNAYGPTECSDDVTHYVISQPPAREVVQLSIGRAIANTQLYILDRHLEPVPIGVVGELYVGGIGVGRGYLHNPVRTAQAFVPDPFGKEAGARLYRTGDLARYLPDGNIEFLGRIDHQVKIHGYRIELGEIEAVLRRHPALRDVVVTVPLDRQGTQRLVAYVVPVAGETPTTPELRSCVAQRLPEYMVPASFVLLEALPLTPNGKIDRRALPSPDLYQRAASFASPRTSEEVALAGIWAEVLGVEKVGVFDNFFELGGDSILGIQLISHVNRAGFEFTSQQLYQHPSVAEMAAVVVKSPTLQAEQDLVTGPIPLTPRQRWLFECDWLNAGSWGHTYLFAVPQAMKAARLEQALASVLRHHDALRMRFVQIGNDWQQVGTGLDKEVPFVHMDVSELSSAALEQTLDAMADRLQAGLNIEDGPLIRVAFFDFGTHQPGQLLMAIHPLVSEVSMWRIILDDLLTAYQKLDRGNAVYLPPKTTSFKRWAQRLVEYAPSPAVLQEIDYWLTAIPKRAVRLPIDDHEGVTADTKGRISMVSDWLDESETQALLDEALVAYNTNVKEFLLVALVQAFEQWTGEPSLLIDLESYDLGQVFKDVDLSRTVGPLAAVFPIYLDLRHTTNEGNALKSLKEQLRNIPHQGIGIGVLRYLSRNATIVQSLQAQPQAAVRFSYHGVFDQLLSNAAECKMIRYFNKPRAVSQTMQHYMLDISARIVHNRLHIDWKNREDLLSSTTLERLVRHFMAKLRSLIEYCQSPEVGGYTPSDFPEAGLDQNALDRFLANIS